MKKIILRLSSIIFFSLLLVGCEFSLDFGFSTTDTNQTTAEKQESTTENTYEDTKDYDLKIHFIDVGQADSSLIELPNGENMLIDAGNNWDGQTVIDYIDNLGITTLHHVIGTHPHADHIGGLDDVINAHFKIENVYLPDKEHTTKTFIDVLLAIENKGLEITFATPDENGMDLVRTTVNGKPLVVSIIGPLKDYPDFNNVSVIIKVVYGQTSYLFTGDAEARAERDMLEAGIDVSADVLKLGHHGSNTSSTLAFLQAVNPTIGIIQVGEGNTYNHPNDDILERLDDLNIRYYRNDLLGTILVQSNGVKITVDGFHFEPEVTDPTPNEPDPGDTEPTGDAIVINEFLPAPSQGNREWVELYNTTDKPVNIGGYIIDDVGDNRKPFVIPDGTMIEAHGFVTFEFTNIFNNDGDSVRLFNASEQLIDAFSYTKTLHNHSYYRITDGGEWAEEMTPSPTRNASNES